MGLLVRDEDPVACHVPRLALSMIDMVESRSNYQVPIEFFGSTSNVKVDKKWLAVSCSTMTSESFAQYIVC